MADDLFVLGPRRASVPEFVDFWRQFYRGDDGAYLRTINFAGAITAGPVFLWHIAQPATTPGYDVNVWRAWGRIDGWIEPEHYPLRPATFRTYLGYRPGSTVSSQRTASHRETLTGR